MASGEKVREPFALPTLMTHTFCAPVAPVAPVVPLVLLAAVAAGGAGAAAVAAVRFPFATPTLIMTVDAWTFVAAATAGPVMTLIAAGALIASVDGIAPRSEAARR